MALPPSFRFGVHRRKINLGFNKKSTAEQVTEGVDLSNKTVVITGVGSGLGKESMRVLTLRGAHVIGLDRTLEAAQQACNDIEGSTTAVACDLSDPESVIAAANTIKEQFSSLDILLNNAGIMAPPLSVVNHYREPLESQFAVNYVGHFLLLNHLFPLLKATPNARIVLVASEGYVMAPKEGIGFDNLDFKRDYDGAAAYGQSKLGVMLMNLILAERLKNSGLSCNAVHPGLIRTNLAHDTETPLVKFVSKVGGPWMRSIGQGAATQCLVATHPELENTLGEHFADCNLRSAVGHATDRHMAEKLWARTFDITSKYLLPVEGVFE